MLSTFFCRAFQCCFAVGARFLPWRTPEVFSGEGSLLRAADILRENGLRRPFVIASRRQCADEHFRALQEKLDEQDILLSIFSSVEPNPSVETVEKIAAQYKIDSCDCFLVIGGGSPMDAAKAAAARLARPDRRIVENVVNRDLGRRGAPRAAGQAAFAACGTLKGPPPHSAAHRRAHDGGHGVRDDHRRRCHRQ